MCIPIYIYNPNLFCAAWTEYQRLDISHIIGGEKPQGQGAYI